MTTSAGEQEDLAEVLRPGSSTPGSAARAFLAWRTTAAAMVPLWIGLAFMAELANPAGDDIDDIGWLLMTAFTYMVGVLVVVPAFAFTLGRWLDRRTADRGLGYSVAIFALYGLGFGIIVGTVIGAGGDATAIGIAALVVAPAIAAAVGRLLCELRGAWRGVVWTVFALAVLAPALVAALYALSGLL